MRCRSAITLAALAVVGAVGILAAQGTQVVRFLPSLAHGCPLLGNRGCSEPAQMLNQGRWACNTSKTRPLFARLYLAVGYSRSVSLRRLSRASKLRSALSFSALASSSADHSETSR